MWETQPEFLVPSLGVAQSMLLRVLREFTMERLFVSLPFKYITVVKIKTNQKRKSAKQIEAETLGNIFNLKYC